MRSDQIQLVTDTEAEETLTLILQRSVWSLRRRDAWNLSPHPHLPHLSPGWLSTKATLCNYFTEKWYFQKSFWCFIDWYCSMWLVPLHGNTSHSCLAIRGQLGCHGRGAAETKEDTVRRRQSKWLHKELREKTGRWTRHLVIRPVSYASYTGFSLSTGSMTYLYLQQYCRR